jgi:pyrroline-5-carboxylate reductase
MGDALLTGLLLSRWLDPGDITVAESHEHAREHIRARHSGVEVVPAAVAADAAVLAVKPGDAEGAARAVAESGIERVLSIMAGVSIESIERWCGGRVRVMRAMPNLPAVIGAAASAVAGSAKATEDDLVWAESVLSSFGVVARVPEYQLDAVTGVSGSGPAYALLLVEALIEAGVEQGLDRGVSRLLAVQTLLGAARLLDETGAQPEEIRGQVTSPGGTTAAGVRTLERLGFRSAVIEAVAAAAERSRELGKPSA